MQLQSLGPRLSSSAEDADSGAGGGELRVYDPSVDDFAFVPPTGACTAAHVLGRVVPLVCLDEAIVTGVVAPPLYPPLPTQPSPAPAAAERPEDMARLIALTLACMAARVVSSALPPEAQEALETSPPTTLAEAHSLMVLLQAEPRPRGRPKKTAPFAGSDADEISDGYATFPASLDASP